MFWKWVSYKQSREKRLELLIGAASPLPPSPENRDWDSQWLDVLGQERPGRELERAVERRQNNSETGRTAAGCTVGRSTADMFRYKHKTVK